jgi:hypothetical protein
MSIRRDDLSPRQKSLRSLGLTTLLVTVLVCAGLAYGFMTGDGGTRWKQLASAAGLLAAAVAVAAMAFDTFDLWVRDRRITAHSVKMTRSLIFVAMLAAAVLSVAAGTPFFFILMTPALLIYLLGVVRRRPAPIRRPADLPGRRSAAAGSGRPAGTSRQRRGGRRRK